MAGTVPESSADKIDRNQRSKIPVSGSNGTVVPANSPDLQLLLDSIDEGGDRLGETIDRVPDSEADLARAMDRPVTSASVDTSTPSASDDTSKPPQPDQSEYEPTIVPDAPLEIISGVPFEREEHVTTIGNLGAGTSGVVNAVRLDDEAFDQLHTAAPQFVEDALNSQSSAVRKAEVTQRVRDTVSNLQKGTRVAAVKVLVAGQLSAAAKKRFMHREVRQGLALKDQVPAVPDLYGIYESEQSLELLMEFIPGYTIADIVEIDGEPMHPRTGMAVSALIARDFYIAHEQKLVHRDIKPANLFMDDTGKPKILDLGLSKKLDPSVTNHTQHGAIFGSGNYMSPEQAEGSGNGQEIDESSDVFSLGVTLTEMFTGQQPYGSGSPTLLKFLFERAELKTPATVYIPRPQNCDVRMAQFLSELQAFLEMMIHPNRAERPTSEDVAKFFHSHSEFGRYDFYDFQDPGQYDKPEHRLLMQTDKPMMKRDDDFAKSRFENPLEMREAMDAGSVTRASGFDFLSQYDNRASTMSTARNVDSAADHSTSNTPVLDATILRVEAPTPELDATLQYVASLEKKTSKLRTILAASAVVIFSVGLIIYGLTREGEVAKIQDPENIKQPDEPGNTPNVIPSAPKEKIVVDVTPEVVPDVHPKEPTLDLVSEENPTHITWDRGEGGERKDIKEFQLMINGVIYKFNKGDLYRTFSSEAEDRGQINSFTFKIPNGDTDYMGHCFIFPTGIMVTTLPGGRTVCQEKNGDMAQNIVDNKAIISWSTIGGGQALGDGRFDVERVSSVPKDMQTQIGVDSNGTRFVNDTFSKWRLSTLRSQQ